MTLQSGLQFKYKMDAYGFLKILLCGGDEVIYHSFNKNSLNTNQVFMDFIPSLSVRYCD